MRDLAATKEMVGKLAGHFDVPLPAIRYVSIEDIEKWRKARGSAGPFGDMISPPVRTPFDARTEPPATDTGTATIVLGPYALFDRPVLHEFSHAVTIARYGKAASVADAGTHGPLFYKALRDVAGFWYNGDLSKYPWWHEYSQIAYWAGRDGIVTPEPSDWDMRSDIPETELVQILDARLLAGVHKKHKAEVEANLANLKAV